MIRKNKQGNRLIAIMAIVIMMSFGCRPDPLVYAPPEDLVGTIYVQLESLGTFNNYLKAIDKTEFKAPLEKSGSWTIFAPTDEAFEAFMAAEGFSSFEDIPADRIQSIVEYSIILDAWNTSTLTYFFPNRFRLGQSFRRTTQYQSPTVTVDAVDFPPSVRDEEEPGTYLIDTSNGRLKTTDYFIESYMSENDIEFSDYDFMFPGETFNAGDMKVFGANVSQQNVISENGIIYALDKVLEPQKNLYVNLSSEEYGDKYSIFKSLLERFASLGNGNDVVNSEGVTERVYTLNYATGIQNNALPFNPDQENHSSNVNTTLANAYGLLVPTNEALLNYLSSNNILGQFYDSYEDMPLDVLGKFLSPHFFNDFHDIVPSRFGQSFDTSLGLVDYKPEDVVDKKFCSNGFFVGVNTVYTNRSFGTILGPLLLDSEYAIMLKAVQDLGIETTLISNGVRFSIFGVKNNQFIDVPDPNSATRRITVLIDDPEYPNVPAFDPLDLSAIYMKVEGDPVEANNRVYPDPSLIDPTSSAAGRSDITYVAQTLQDIVLNQIINEDIDAGSNNYYQARSGEFVRAFDGNSAVGGGNIEESTSVQIEETIATDNGNFYEMSGITKSPSRFTYAALQANSENFSLFLQVLENGGGVLDIAGSEDKLINVNLRRTFTLFAPNNTAVNKAIADGVIVDPNLLDGLSELELASARIGHENFYKKHFLQQGLATDGKSTGTFSSLFSSKVIDLVEIFDQFSITNTTTSITLTNEETGESVTTDGMTNILSKRIVIHEINNYIK